MKDIDSIMRELHDTMYNYEYCNYRKMSRELFIYKFKAEQQIRRQNQLIDELRKYILSNKNCVNECVQTLPNESFELEPTNEEQNIIERLEIQLFEAKEEIEDEKIKYNELEYKYKKLEKELTEQKQKTISQQSQLSQSMMSLSRLKQNKIDPKMVTSEVETELTNEEISNIIEKSVELSNFVEELENLDIEPEILELELSE